MSYYRLIERLVRHGRPSEYHTPISMEYAVDSVDMPDFDIPGVMTTMPTGRVMLVVEGERHLVGPLIEAAIDACLVKQ